MLELTPRGAGEPGAGARADRPRGRDPAPRSSTCDADDLPALAEAGIELVGENRAQDLLAKQERHRDLFTWDFIGALQSRKVKDIAPNVRLIHSVASESALRRLEANPGARGAGPGERGGRGAQGGRRPGRAGRLTSSAARAR